MKYLFMIISLTCCLLNYHAYGLKYIEISSEDLKNRMLQVVSKYEDIQNKEFNYIHNTALGLPFSKTQSYHPSGWRNIWFKNAPETVENASLMGHWYWQLQLAISYFNGINKLENDSRTISLVQSKPLAYLWFNEALEHEDEITSFDGKHLLDYAKNLMGKNIEEARISLCCLRIDR
jgi:hypothetical protein